MESDTDNGDLREVGDSRVQIPLENANEDAIIVTNFDSLVVTKSGMKSEDFQSSIPDENQVKENNAQRQMNVKKDNDDDWKKGGGDLVKINRKESEEITLYYGINGVDEETDVCPVYTDRKEALRVVKKSKGARFKVFKTEAEAVEFARSPPEANNVSSLSGANCGRDLDTCADISAVAGGEKSSTFRGPRSQSLVKLRKAIECGDLEFVTQTVWSNPRYLISSGDTPTILQEGSRYNALHVAAKMRQSELFQWILGVVENPQFMRVLYAEDTDATCMERVRFLTDLYINTPDKGLCETPLHFASKFGSAEIVALLTSHPLCDTKLKNKYGQNAREIVCCRCPNETPELRSRIELCFQDRYYVPVLRSMDNSQPPVIGIPWSPTLKKPVVPASVAVDDPLESPRSVKAYAGPMSPHQAAEFHRRWSTPSRSRSSEGSAMAATEIRLTDPDKGLERIGRSLANEMRVSWAEEWPWLRAYCDLSTSEGLARLELHLRNKYNEALVREDVNVRKPDTRLRHASYPSDEVPLSPNIFTNNQPDAVNQSSDGISSLCEALRKLHLDSSFSSSVSTNDVDISLPSSNQKLCICPRRMRCHSGPASLRLGSYGRTDWQPKGNGRTEGLPRIQMKPEEEIGGGETIKELVESKESKNEDCRVADLLQSDRNADGPQGDSSPSAAILDRAATATRAASMAIVNGIAKVAASASPAILEGPESKSFDVNAFLRQTCEVIGNQIYTESNRFVDILEDRGHYTRRENFSINPQQQFGRAILPYVKCLYDIAAHLEHQLPSTDILSSVHVDVARHVTRLASANEGTSGVSEFLGVMSVPRAFDVEQAVLSDMSDEEIQDVGLGARSQWRMRQRRKRTVAPTIGNHLRCILELLTNGVTNEDCQCSWGVDVDEDAAQDEMWGEIGMQMQKLDGQIDIETVGSQRKPTRPLAVVRSSSSSSGEDLNASKSLHSDVSSSDLFFTPESSFHSSRCSSVSEVWTPDEGLAVFVEGPIPTKADVHVLRAIDVVNLDPVSFPHIHRWKSFMAAVLRDDGESLLMTPIRCNRRSGFSTCQSLLTSTPVWTTRTRTWVRNQRNNYNSSSIIKELKYDEPFGGIPFTDLN